jgi:hypothetical protein
VWEGARFGDAPAWSALRGSGPEGGGRFGNPGSNTRTLEQLSKLSDREQAASKEAFPGSKQPCTVPYNNTEVCTVVRIEVSYSSCAVSYSRKLLFLFFSAGCTLLVGCSAQVQGDFLVSVQCCFLGSLWRLPNKFFKGMKS